MGVVVQNVNVYLVDTGSGRPILFLHGVPDTAEIWSDVIIRLSTGYRCLAPDLPGFGRSIAPPKFDCSLENRVDFINELVENIGINIPLNLVVHDHVGPYGLAWTVKHPAKVNRIVIMHTLFQSDHRWHMWPRLRRTPLGGVLSLARIDRLVVYVELR